MKTELEQLILDIMGWVLAVPALSCAISLRLGIHESSAVASLLANAREQILRKGVSSHIVLWLPEQRSLLLSL